MSLLFFCLLREALQALQALQPRPDFAAVGGVYQSAGSCSGKEDFMRCALPIMAMAVMLAGSAAMTSRPVEAAIAYPWCAHYMAPNTAHNCGFVTWEQCLATVSGIGGTCEANPYYVAPLAPNGRRRVPR